MGVIHGKSLKKVYLTLGIYPFSVCNFHFKKHQLYLEYFTEEGAHVSVVDFTQDGRQNGFTMCIPFFVFEFATYFLLYSNNLTKYINISDISLHFSANLN